MLDAINVKQIFLEIIEEISRTLNMQFKQLFRHAEIYFVDIHIEYIKICITLFTRVSNLVKLYTGNIYVIRELRLKL